MSTFDQSVRERQSLQGVLLLHGFGGFPIQTALLARCLRQAGYTVLNPFYRSWSLPLDRIVNHLQPGVSALAAQVDTLHCVGHSMGGLVLRVLLTGHRPPNLGRTVMLGTPHGGSEIADLLYRLRLHGPILNRAGSTLRTVRPPELDALFGPVDYPLGIIAGDRPANPFLADRIFRAPHDGKVSVAATHVAGEMDHLVMPVAHTAMIYNPAVADQLLHFLRNGRFLQS